MPLPCASCLLILWTALLGAATPAGAALSPQQVAVVVNRSMRESVSVGYHYARQRGIPDTHVVPLDLGPVKDTISRKEYDQAIVQPLRQALHKRGLTGQIRALVTVYGLPLIVQAPPPTEQEKTWAADAEERFVRLRHDLEALARRVTPEASAAPTSGATAERFSVLMERIKLALRERSRRAQEETEPQKARQAIQELGALILRLGGRAMLVQSLRPTVQRSQEELAQLQQQVVKSQSILDALIETPSDAHRQQAYRITEALLGLQGLIRLAMAEVEGFRYQQGEASVDSELSLLWVDAGLYRINGRRLNPLHYALQPAAGKAVSSLPILMVSRLDAPTAALAKQLVEQALLTEKQGLSGTVYLDSRGLKSPGAPWSTSAYDRNLEELAALFRRLTPYPVVLEETARTLNQPGEAPQVAVYVGWYRLRAYEDVFTFSPGAIGYHIASGEAVSVHNPQEPGWCKNALERGITATLGPTSEPYLDAFPPPADFFGLLLTGQYSLAEVYYLTTRYISWRMVLFGDPLYNPWRGQGLASGEHLTLHASPGGPGGVLPTPPADLPFPEPVQTMQQFQHQRQALLDQAEALERELTRRTRAESSSAWEAPGAPGERPPGEPAAAPR